MQAAQIYLQSQHSSQAQRTVDRIQHAAQLHRWQGQIGSTSCGKANTQQLEPAAAAYPYSQQTALEEAAPACHARAGQAAAAVHPSTRCWLVRRTAGPASEQASGATNPRMAIACRHHRHAQHWCISKGAALGRRFRSQGTQLQHAEVGAVVPAPALAPPPGGTTNSKHAQQCVGPTWKPPSTNASTSGRPKRHVRSTKQAHA